jgi:hypothetical protein
MKKILLILLLAPLLVFGQDSEPSKFKKELKKVFKYSTFYAAANGSNSLSDVNVYSVTNGLQTAKVETPFDYSLALGVRKIARFGYENRADVFYDGSENTISDDANVGKVNGFEFLFEADWRRQQGRSFFNQHHFLRYVANNWIVKTEYLTDGFADIEFFEASQRYRHKLGRKFSLNIGAVERFSKPYGYDPLEEWMLSNGNLHYTYLALQEGYSVEFDGTGGETYYSPGGQLVAENTEVWEGIVIPQVLSDYVDKKINQAPVEWNYSLVLGFDYYHYTKDFWVHGFGNVMPYHYDTKTEFSYHQYNGGQWVDYSGGLIFGWKITKSLGVFAEGTYNKYWNRKWHNFSVGANFIIL